MIKKSTLIQLCTLITLLIITGCSSQPSVEDISEHYSDLIDVSLSYSTSTYEDVFPICGDDPVDGCKTTDFSDFNELSLVHVVDEKIVLKQPSKFFIEKAVQDESGQKTVIEKCDETVFESWDSAQDDVLVEWKEFPCYRFAETLLTGGVLGDLKGILGDNPEIDFLSLQGKEAIVLFSGRESSEGSFVVAVYLDKASYAPLQVVFTEKNIGEGVMHGKSVEVLQLKRIVTKFDEFSHKVLPGDLSHKFVNIERCSFTTDERQKIIDQLNTKKQVLITQEKESQQKVSKEQFDDYEALRITFPTHRCKGDTPRSYEDYLSPLKNGCGSYFS